MTKETLEKILNGGVVSVNDITPDEKNSIYELFARYGMPKSTCYLRLFYKGFSQWEISGVTRTKEEFLLTTSCTKSDGVTSDEGSQGYGYVKTLEEGYDTSNFFDLVKGLGMTGKLIAFMNGRGMASHVTVKKRFTENDWKQWEVVGVRKILQEHMEYNEL